MTGWGWALLVALGVCAGVAGTASAQTVTTTVFTGGGSVGAMAIDPDTNMVYVTDGSNTLVAVNSSNTRTTAATASAASLTAIALEPTFNTAYVLDANSNKIHTFSQYPFDGVPLYETGTFNDGNSAHPVAIAVRSAYHKIYVVNSEGSLSIFSPTGNGGAWVVERHLQVGNNPVAIAVNSQTGYVYVANKGDGTVTVVDGSDAIVATITVGSAPAAIAVNSATNHAYVANSGGSTISDINESTFATPTAVTVGGNPAAVAVNPTTNEIYVANTQYNGSVSIIAGSTDTVTGTVLLPGGGNLPGQAAIVVDPGTDIAYVSINGSSASAIETVLGTPAALALNIGANGTAALGVNPVTHRAYVGEPDTGIGGALGVVDGATNKTGAIAEGSTQPWAIAVNPVTNQIYVANSGSNSLTQIDGATNTVVGTATTGANPHQVVVDPIKNLIYTANFGDPTITAVDGTNLNNVGTYDYSSYGTNLRVGGIAINPILGKGFGYSVAGDLGLDFQEGLGGGTFAGGFAFGDTGIVAVATNPALGMNYQLLAASNVLSADEGQAFNGYYVNICGGSTAMDVNPATNTVWMTCGDGTVEYSQGTTGFYGGTQGNVAVTGATGSVAIAVNPVTNLVYVVNESSNNVTVVNGNTFATQLIAVGTTPVALAINQATNKIYVVNEGSNNISVIDGATGSVEQTVNAITTTNSPNLVAANPVNNTIYSADATDGNVNTLVENTIQPDALTVAITPFSGNMTNTVLPQFNFTSSGAYAVLFQVDTQQGSWRYAGYAQTGFQGTAPAQLTPGFHILYAFGVNGQEATSEVAGDATGVQSNPVVGAIASYGFLVAPGIAGTPYYPSNYGNVPVGSGKGQQLIFVNNGGAPLNFSYAISGPNAADFATAPNPQGSYGQGCETFGGVLPGGQNCLVYVVFTPSGLGSESATLTFTDDSLGIAGSTQAVGVTGNGAYGITMTVTGSGLVTDDQGILSCSSGTCQATYAQGTAVNFMAQGMTGYAFQGWGGDCATATYNTGYCHLVFNQSYVASATFTTAPPPPVFSQVPTDPSMLTSGMIGWNENGSGPITFQCALDTTAFTPCTDPYNYMNLGFGAHTFMVEAINSNNMVSSPQAFSWTITQGASATLTVTLQGTGSGNVNDGANLNCTEISGVVSGTCSGTYPTGTVVTLTATAGAAGSTFAGWGGACSGVQACQVTLSGNMTVTASFAPQPMMRMLPFAVSATPQTQTALYDCPSNPNPTPGNPCTDPNAHQLKLTVPSVTTAFTMTVVATEVPPSLADGICENGNTPANDFDCRLASYFTYQTLANGDKVVPHCDPYANGNCVFYSAYYGTPGVEPPTSYYSGPVDWFITWNNESYVPPTNYPYQANNPRLYDDPDYPVSQTTPYGTNCSSPMLINGTPTSPAIYCQFIFDITTALDLTEPVDTGIGGKTKQFNDVVVAFPLTLATPVLSATKTADAAAETYGMPIGFTVSVSNSSAPGTGAASNVTINDPLPGTGGTNWTISPAYVGPGTCAITGAAGGQTLACAVGNLSPAIVATVHVVSASATPGTYSNTATVTAGNNATLSPSASTTVNKVTPAFSGLTPSQSIAAGTATIALAGTVSSGTNYPASGEMITVTIGSVMQNATIGTNGAFSLNFNTSTLSASGTPYPITYVYTGDANFTTNGNTTTTLTVNPASTFATLTVTDLGTGTGFAGQVGGAIQCSESGGVQTGTCSANYATGTVVTLTATATAPSTFAGWGGACSGVGNCTVTLTSNMNVTASFAPPPTVIPLAFVPSMAPQSMAATFDCPSNPHPSPSNPCLDPNAHQLQLTVPSVITPFTVMVRATEVPLSQANGICANGNTVNNDFDCRFVTDFTYTTLANGDKVVPQCDPYANGNCVFYSVYYGAPGTEPPSSYYNGPIDWYITWNNESYVPPTTYPYQGSNPRLFDDPDYAVSSTTPFGTSCTSPMMVGVPPAPTNPPIYCQFTMDITTFLNTTAPVDTGIGGKTKQFNDVVVAFPLVTEPTIASSPDAAMVPAFSGIGFTMSVSNGNAPAAGSINGVTLTDSLPAGTGINWSISPAYAGPGTCAITGAVGSQILNCSFGNLASGASATVHVVTASAGAGVYQNAATIVANGQSILTVAAVTVAQGAASFSNLTPSQTIPYGTKSVNLGGTLGAAGNYPAAGETVAITVNKVTQNATLSANGVFTSAFNTATIPASTTPYAITYAFAGDSNFTPVSNSSTTLTVGAASQTITFAGGPAAAAYGSTFAVSASASSGLTVTITPTGGCTISSGTVTVTASTGTCTLTATQAGNANYAAATPVVRTTTLTKATSVTAIVSNTPNPSTVGQAVSFSVKVTGRGTPTGTVTVTASTSEKCTATLSAGAGSCAITFTTSGARTVAAAYSGDTNFSGGSSASVSQIVNGSGASTLKITPSTVNFGTVNYGNLGLETVTLSNTGSSPIAISKVTIGNVTGGDSDDFAVFNLCPSTLAAGKSCSLEAIFSPDTDQTTKQSATLTITDNATGSPQTAPMTATVINPQGSLSQSELSFGKQKTGTTSTALSSTLKNTGTTPLIISAVSISGNFALTSATTCKAGITLAPKATCQVSVTFHPTSTGKKNGKVTINDNTLGTSEVVGLDGTGN